MLDASKGTVAVENGQSQISRSAREDEMNGASRTNRDLVGTDGSAKDTVGLNDYANGAARAVVLFNITDEKMLSASIVRFV